jgi:hypothetical protein
MPVDRKGTARWAALMRAHASAREHAGRERSAAGIDGSQTMRSMRMGSPSRGFGIGHICQRGT